jgi:hypothetical protein
MTRILETLALIAAPMRPDGTWNRDREACRQLAAAELERLNASTAIQDECRVRPYGWMSEESMGQKSHAQCVDAVMRQVSKATGWDGDRATLERALWDAIDNARLCERERLRLYFQEALADKDVVWPGEVDILYDKCFAVPYVPGVAMEAAAGYFCGTPKTDPDYAESEAALRVSIVDRLRKGPAPLDDPDLNDQAADFIAHADPRRTLQAAYQKALDEAIAFDNRRQVADDPLMQRINRSGPFKDAP